MTLHRSSTWTRAAPSPVLDLGAEATPPAPALPVSLGDLVGAVRRHRLALAAWLALCLACAGWYLHVTPTEFRAAAAIILEPRRAGTAPPGPQGTAVQALDVAQAEGQIQVIRSERVLAAVFDTLGLEDAPEFVGEAPGSRGWIAALLGTRSPPEQASDRRARAYEAFTERVSVARLGQSYVLEIAYRARSPEQAARVANAVTAQYLKAQIDAKAAAVEQGTEFLQGRIQALKAEQNGALEGVRAGRIPDMQLSDADARVIGAALKPLGRFAPKTGLVLAFALTCGLLSGLGVVAVRQALDRTLKRRQQIWPALGVECLGVLSRSGRARGRRPGGLLDEAVARPSSRFGRTFRALRTVVLLSGANDRRRSVGIVSWSHGEGRTTVAANLAAVLAVARDKVTLVDGDVVNPTLTTALAPGTVPAQDGERPEPGRPRVVPHLREGSLRLMSAAWTGAGELSADLGSAGMQDLLTRLRAASDLVFDLPPLATSPDAIALGRCLDGVILVIEAGRTTVEEAAEALRTLRTAGIPVLGVVLNKAEPVRERRRGIRERGGATVSAPIRAQT